MLYIMLILCDFPLRQKQMNLQLIIRLQSAVLWIYRGPGFLRSYDSAFQDPLPPVSKMSLFLCISPVELTDGGREGKRGWARSQIIRRRESLVLCKSFNTLW
jgi:hypothetical protein